MACTVTATLGNLGQSPDCNLRGGLKTIKWIENQHIDWDEMTTNTANANVNVDGEVIQFAYTGSETDASWHTLTFERKLGSYNFTFTEDADVYEQLITVTFEGKSKADREIFLNALSVCKIVAVVYDNNCQARLIGVDYDGTFTEQIKSLRIVRHLDASGEFGTSKARDEMDLGGESLFPPMYVNTTSIPETALG